VGIPSGLNDVEIAPHANSLADDAPKEGCGTTGAGGANNGEQQIHRSSCRLALWKWTPEGGCSLTATTASEPNEFIGAPGSHRS